MYRSRDKSGLGVGALSRSWRVRAATVLIMGVLGTVAGLASGDVMNGMFLGLVAGVGCVVMGESSMDTGAYKYPELF